MPDQEQPPRPPSPFDALAETLWRLVGDELCTALTSPSFESALRRARIAVTPACDGVPEPPEDWVSDGLDLLGGGDAAIVDPGEHLDELWRVAYEAGWQGYAAQHGDLAADLERSAALVAELRRQLDAQLRQVGELRWVARYLPPAVRFQVMTDPPTPGAWRGPRPDEDWAQRVDRRATAAGLTPYPKGQS